MRSTSSRVEYAGGAAAVKDSVSFMDISSTAASMSSNCKSVFLHGSGTATIKLTSLPLSANDVTVAVELAVI